MRRPWLGRAMADNLQILGCPPQGQIEIMFYFYWVLDSESGKKCVEQNFATNRHEVGVLGDLGPDIENSDRDLHFGLIVYSKNLQI